MFKNLILLVTCFYSFSLVESDRLQNATTWKASFDRIFGPTREGSLLTESQLMQSLVSLHKAAEKLESLDPNDKQKVEFWSELVFDFSETGDDAADCNAEYMETMSEIYLQQNSEDNANFEKLYNISRVRIIEHCEEYFLDLPDRVAPLVPVDNIMNLMDAYTERIDTRSDSNLLKSLVKPIRQSLEAKKALSSDEFVDRWSEGPCLVLLSALEGPDMMKYSDFIDMCLYRPEDVRAISSDSIRQWISIISMCKHIDTLIPDIAQCIDQDAILIKGLWERKYQEIFGPDGETAPMNDKTLMQSMIFLRANADQLRSMEPDKSARVKFWYENMNFDSFDCNAEYLDRLSEAYRGHNHLANPNFQLLYATITEDLLEFCDRLLTSKPESLAARVTDETLLSFLTNDNPNANPTPLSNPDLAESLARPAIRSMEEGNRGAEVMEVWQKSPCTDIQVALEDPDLDDYGDFIEMMLYEGEKHLDYCSNSNYIWVRVVYICTILDRWIPIFAETNSWAARARRNLRYFFAKYSLRQMLHSPIKIPRNSEASADIPEERVIEVDGSSMVIRTHRNRSN